MKVQNLDRLFWEAFMLELNMMTAIREQNFLVYNILAYRYKELAEKCKEATFEWRI